MFGQTSGAKARRTGLESDGHGPKKEYGIQLEAKGIQFYQGDLRDKSVAAEVCANQDAVFHCAALSSPWGKYQDFTAAMWKRHSIWSTVAGERVYSDSSTYQRPVCILIIDPDMTFMRMIPCQPNQ